MPTFTLKDLTGTSYDIDIKDVALQSRLDGHTNVRFGGKRITVGLTYEQANRLLQKARDNAAREEAEEARAAKVAPAVVEAPAPAEPVAEVEAPKPKRKRSKKAAA